MTRFAKYAACGLLALLLGCSGNADDVRQNVIAEKVQERLDLFERTLRDNCHQKVLEKAGAIADSILILTAQRSADTLNKPPVPLRPDRPDIKTLDSFLPVRPFFRDTSLEVID